jgi:hypothetical protein
MTHTQRMPKAWPSLFEVASQLVDAVPTDAHRELQLAIDEFPDSEIDKARYYALGELGSQFEVYLDATAPGSIVEDTVSGLLYGHADYCIERYDRSQRSQGLYRCELNPTALSWGTHPLTKQAFRDMPTPTRMLSDMLSVQPYMRSLSGDRPDFSEVSRSINTVDSFSANVFSGSLSIFDRWVELHLPEEKQKKDCLLSEVIDMSDLQPEKILHAAMNAARKQHHDEFIRRDFTKYTRLESDGRMVFMSALVPATPDLSRDDRRAVIHDQRIGCPVVFVPGLIPKILTILLDTLSAVDRRIKNSI